MKHFALIGQNIGYSISPRVHKIIYSELGIEAEHHLISLSPSELDGAIESLKQLEGFNVTQPHKNSMAKYLEKSYSDYNAINTVNVKDGKLYGYNTDAYGFRTHLCANLDNISDKVALVLGAGGMAEVAAKVLKNLGAKVIIYNRTYEKAETLANSLDVGCAQDLTKVKSEILVNCNSGFLYAELPFVSDLDLSETKFAYDTIYKETSFQTLCYNNNIRMVNGLGLLIYQAIKADEIFLDCKFSKEDIDALYNKVDAVLKEQKQ